MFQIESSICGECGGCVAVCPTEALELHSDGLKIKQSLCTDCQNCIIFCPVGAFLTDDHTGLDTSLLKDDRIPSGK
jgi:Fe-S-cluster-containing hydrogenase component 2